MPKLLCANVSWTVLHKELACNDNCHIILYLPFLFKSSICGYQQENYDNDHFVHLRDALILETITITTNKTTTQLTTSINDWACGTLRNVCGEVEEGDLMENNEQVWKKKSSRGSNLVWDHQRAKGEGGCVVWGALRRLYWKYASLTIWWCDVYCRGEGEEGICINFKIWIT